MGRWGLVGFEGVRASGGWEVGERGIGSNRVVGLGKSGINKEAGMGGFLKVKLIIRGLRHKQKLKKCINKRTNGWAS